MGFKCGIVGLPNVGKSTLFNALTNSSKAQAANFPFCTIDPNIGLVPVPDERLDKLVDISSSKKKIHTTISFVDIAGLVKGASKGEGLGNKFLSHIREVDAIIHMIRCFDSDDIQNVNPDVNPIRDLEIIETEMKLADLESIQKRIDKKNRKNIEEVQIEILEKAMNLINEDKDLTQLNSEFELKDIKQCGLLSTKPKLYVCNVDEESIAKGNKYTDEFISKFGDKNTLIISADIENQINELGDDNEKKNFQRSEGLYYAASSFTQKALNSLGILLAGQILKFVEFPQDSTEKSIPGSIVNELVLTSLICLAIIYFVAVSLLFFYNISRQTHNENLRSINRI